MGTMLRIHFMQQWFGYSDPAMEETLHDVPLLRRFAGLSSLVHTVECPTAKVADITMMEACLHGAEDFLSCFYDTPP